MEGTTNKGQELDVVLVHCAIAFGQGSGNIGISEDGVQRLLELFRPMLAHHAGNWKEGSGLYLGYAKSIGRLAAHLALDAGELEIDAASVTKAKDTASPRIFCLKNG